MKLVSVLIRCPIAHPDPHLFCDFIIARFRMSWDSLSVLPGVSCFCTVRLSCYFPKYWVICLHAAWMLCSSQYLSNLWNNKTPYYALLYSILLVGIPCHPGSWKIWQPEVPVRIKHAFGTKPLSHFFHNEGYRPSLNEGEYIGTTLVKSKYKILASSPPPIKLAGLELRPTLPELSGIGATTLLFLYRMGSAPPQSLLSGTELKIWAFH